jgi:hypothetical protein
MKPEPQYPAVLHLRTAARPTPVEVATDYLGAERAAACHVMEQYANNAIEPDHGRLKS